MQNFEMMVTLLLASITIGMLIAFAMAAKFAKGRHLNTKDDWVLWAFWAAVVMVLLWVTFADLDPVVSFAGPVSLLIILLAPVLTGNPRIWGSEG